jgi:hypothetical protein
MPERKKCRRQTAEEALREAAERKGHALTSGEERIVRTQHGVQPRVVCPEPGALAAEALLKRRELETSCEIWLDRDRKRWELVNGHGTIAAGKLARGRVPARVRKLARKAGCKRPKIVETRLR